MSDYHPGLYVQREELFQKLLGWVGNPSAESRLWSLLGAAGAGKSWFLANAYQRLRQNPGCLPIWLDLSVEAVYPKLDDDSNSALEPFPDCRTVDGRQQWLARVITDARQICPGISAYQPSVTFSAMFRQFVTDLCRLCAHHSPILIVDGYDEVTTVLERVFLQEHIFSNFLSDDCTRLIVARRDQPGQGFVSHPILGSWDTAVPLPAFEPRQSREQIEQIITKRDKDKAPEDPELDQHLQPYLTGNPFINTQLYERTKNKPLAVPDKADLEACLAAVLARAGLDYPSHAGLLATIAGKLEPTWTAQQLRNKGNITLGAHPKLENLFQAGLLAHIEGTSRYKMDEGLYQLLQFLRQT